MPGAAAAAAFLGAGLAVLAAKRAARSGRTEQTVRRYSRSAGMSFARGVSGWAAEDAVRARRRMAIAVVAAFVIALNVNWLARFQEKSWDVTEDGRNSLLPATVRALDTLQGRVRVYSFLPDGLRVRGVPVAEETRGLLQRFAEQDPRVDVSFVDAEHAAELRAEKKNPEEFLLVEYQGRRAFIPAAALVAAPERRARDGEPDAGVFDGENRLTRELLRLADPRMPNVYFTYGRRELSPEAGAYPERAASRFVRLLSASGMRVRQHAIARSGAVPPDCDVLVVAAPGLPFLAEEAEEIARYLERGGRLFVFAPAAGKEFVAATDPLNALLFTLGGAFRDDIVRDERNNDNGRALFPLGRAKAAGEGAPETVFPMARSIRDNPRAFENGWTVERMIESHPDAVAAAPGGGGVVGAAGPFTFAYRAVKDAAGRGARVVVMSSGLIASDAGLGLGRNEGVVSGLMRWLAGREEEESLPERRWTDRGLAYSAAGLRAVLWIDLVALPLAWVLAGIFVWRARRE